MKDTSYPAGAVRPFSRILRVTPPNLADPIAFVLLAGAAVLLFRAAEGMAEPLSRLFAALLASLLFTLVVATLAARSGDPPQPLRRDVRYDEDRDLFSLDNPM